MSISEKRKAERILIELPLRYWVTNERNKNRNTSEVVEGISKDISDGGICIRTGISAKPSFKEGRDIIGMEIDLFPHFKNVKAFGKPKWWSSIEEDEKVKFQIGIEFMESKEGNHKILQRYLKNSIVTK